jgi:hypothetical protein
MVKYFSLLAIIFLGFGANAQTNMPQSSDDETKAPNKTAKNLELIAIFKDAIDVPTKYNAYVKPYISLKAFPKNKNYSKSQYDSYIEKWINDNPSIIDEFIVVRKKAHEELYGPRVK